MKAHLCGLWDGTNLWVQWEDVAPTAGYRLQVRARKPGAIEWEKWRDIGGPEPLRKAWLVVPMWREGAEVQARVAIRRDIEPEWFEASEVTFERSRCLFEIQAGPRGVHYQPGTEFHSIVDHAACHYTLNTEVELAAGETQEVEMTASLASGYCQLDAPADFTIRPSLGLCIFNSAPSVDDVTETGAGFTTLRMRKQDAPIKIAFGKNHFR